MKTLLIFTICIMFMFAGWKNDVGEKTYVSDSLNTNEDCLQTNESLKSDTEEEKDDTLTNTVPEELIESVVEPEKDASGVSNAEDSEYVRLFFDDTKPVIGMYGINRWIGNKAYAGLIDSNGKLIVDPKYVYACHSSEGYSIVGVYHYLIKHDYIEKDYYDMFGNKITSEKICTYVNSQGEECFGYFTDADLFIDGFAVVEDANEKSHIINTSGEVVVSFEQSDIHICGGFADGMLCFSSEGKYGFMDENFKIVIDPIFERARNFSDGLAAVSIDGKLSYIDKAGNIVIQTEESYYTDSPDFTYGLSPAVDPESKKMGFIDETGNFVIPAQYSHVLPFNDVGLAMVWGSERVSWEYRAIDIFTTYYCGYINTKGETVIPLEYYSKMKLGSPLYANGVIELYKDGYTYFFNPNGEIIGKMKSGY